jgi:thiol-disulfide isomerase/thioredoxin
MENNKEFSKKDTLSVNKFRQFIRKNGFSIFMGIGVVVLLVSPDAKSWLLRQLMITGIFNANMHKESFNEASQSAIDFNFEDGKGNIQNTSSLRGKVVFINFWASWCPPCRAELPSIETLYSKFENNANVFFLIINEDNEPLVAKEYLKKEKFSVPFYRTKSRVPATIYTGTLPTTVVLDKTGKIRYRNEGFANYASEKFIQQIEKLIRE